MVRNIVVFGGSSHPQLTNVICDHLGIPAANILLSKFAVGETRVEIGDSVRGKDVYIIQSHGGKVNDHLMELLITISACKTASARRVTAVLPLFPYSRQSDVPYNKTGAPLSKQPTRVIAGGEDYTFDSRPQTPLPGQHENGFISSEQLHKHVARLTMEDRPNGVSNHGGQTEAVHAHSARSRPQRSDTVSTNRSSADSERPRVTGNDHAHASSTANFQKAMGFEPQKGYRQWVARAGTLVADLLTCAGADHVITMDLHDPQYQGFFDIPVDNLYGRHLLKNYIQYQIPNYKDAVVVSPDAGGAKRATAIADSLAMPFALIHKVSFNAQALLALQCLTSIQERRPKQVTDRQNATMILVGNVAERTAILVDDLVDTANTLTRAAKLLRKEGATRIIALVTHGLLSGDAIERINASALDKIVVTNSVDQSENKVRCPKLEVLEVGHVFAEVRYSCPGMRLCLLLLNIHLQAIRRVHHGESISVLFQHD